LIENQIAGVDQLRGRSEVLDDLDFRSGGVEQFMMRALVRINVGAAEGIDRLLWIGHHEEPIALVTLDEDAAENLPLKIIVS